MKQNSANDSGAKAWMVDVSVTGNQNKVRNIKAVSIQLFKAHGKRDIFAC